MIKRVALAGVIATPLMVSPVLGVLCHDASLLATGQLSQFQHLLRSLGPWGPAVSIALLVAQAVALPVPTAIIMVANGLAFGPWRGALISLVGTAAGACVAYAVGRWIGRGLAESDASPYRRFVGVIS